MKRVASLFLPQLAIERLRRLERPGASRPEPRVRFEAPIDDDPGACSVPRGGLWRPGARWAQGGVRTREDVAAEIASLPAHQRPTVRKLGRRTEAAEPPFLRLPVPGAAQPAGVAVHLASTNMPMALAAQIGRREEIVAACPAALALGVRVGMAATHARVLVSDLDLRPAETQADMALLDRLALRAVRSWTPVASVCVPDGLWLDLTGVTHLFGGEERFCRRVVAFCRRAGFTARVAVADTPGAAHAVARYGRDPVAVIPLGKSLEALSPLPVAALRLSPEALATARKFGLERVRDLAPKPRGPLARRLGRDALLRLDQALGRVAEPIVAMADEEAPRAERRLVEPIGTAEQIAQVMSDLLADLVGTLQARGVGVRALRLTCHRVDGAEQPISIGTARPNRDAAHLLRLLSMRIERIDPGLGLEAFDLVAVRTEPLGAVAFSAILTGETGKADLPRLVDTLVGRAGPQALFRVAPVESHVPERAVTRTDPLAEPGSWPAWRRPPRLLRRPEPLAQVVALLPDQPPRRFEWRGTSYRVVNADGPERIHGEWWRSEQEVWAVRDYFRLEDEAGGRFWVFRRGDGVDAATGGLTWWMHGFFG